MPEKLFYATAIESMFVRGVGKDLSTEGRRKLKEAGLDLAAKPAATYPLDVVRGWMELVRQDLYPGMPRARADELLGRRLVTGFGETLIGKATFSVLKLLGPVRTIRRVDENLKQLNNFSE